jgi:RNA polymerase sigma-70 factor (ECF subfamily)
MFSLFRRPPSEKTSPAVTVTEAYRRYAPLLKRKCVRALANEAEAEEVTQETFIRLWRSGMAQRPANEVVAWLYRVSTRLIIDHLRQRQRRQPVAVSAEMEASVAHPAPTIEALLHVREQLQALAQAVPAEELEVVLLHRLDGLTQVEIGEVTGMSDRTVRRILTRLEQRVDALQGEPA